GSDYYHFGLARLLRDGSLDHTFGKDGAVFTPGTESVGALVRQRGGRIVAAGYTTTKDGKRVQITLARYLNNGTLDRSFGRRGVTQTRVGRFAAASSLTLRGGKLIVGGSTFHPKHGVGDGQMLIARYFLRAHRRA